MSSYTADTHVATIASEHPSTIAVFERRGLDFCCGGKRPLGVACDELGLSPEVVLAEVRDAIAGPEPETAWSSAPLPALVAHILDRYHRTLRRDLPTIDSLAQRVAARHGDHKPSLVRVRELVELLGDEMSSHMMKEEHVLFPMIERLAAAPAGSMPLPIDGPVQAMEHEHDEVASMLAELRQLTAGFQPPAEACNSYRGLFQMLADLERDTHVHIHLENNVLFPRAQQLAVAS
jgi:regulator of cell morphogenesis and NO signaling